MRDVDDRRLAAELDTAAEDAPELFLDPDRLLGAADRRRRRRSAFTVGLSAAVVAAAVVLAGLLGGRTGDRVPDTAASTTVPGLASSTAPAFASAPAPALGRLGEGDLSLMSSTAGDVGLGPFAGVFTNLRTDDCRCSVTVFLTDLGQKDAFLAAMTAREPRIDASHVLFKQGVMLRQECRDLVTAMSNDLMARGGLPFQVYSASATIECSTVEVGVSDVRAAQAYFDDPANGIRREGVTFTAVQGAPVQPY
ncbi:hypothetical protein [Streptodolium elevatio]|uniref:Uncharacterized protein n=1 Tax=Streptodolium elevatio TaxID=3157996 RepID=A0ABV3DM80_9ACTN